MSLVELRSHNKEVLTDDLAQRLNEVGSTLDGNTTLRDLCIKTYLDYGRRLVLPFPQHTIKWFELYSGLDESEKRELTACLTILARSRLATVGEIRKASTEDIRRVRNVHNFTVGGIGELRAAFIKRVFEEPSQ